MQQLWWPVSLGFGLLACTSEATPVDAEPAANESPRDGGRQAVDYADSAPGAFEEIGDASPRDARPLLDAGPRADTDTSTDGVVADGADEPGSGSPASGSETADESSLTDDGDTSGVDETSDAGPDSQDTSSEPDSNGLPESCFVAPPGVDEFPHTAGELDLQMGARDPETGVDWLPLGRDCAIPIGGIGQAGLTARLAVRVRAPEGPVTRAKLRVTLVNYRDTERDPAPSSGQNVVQTLECREDGWCYQVPVLVEISHLARLPELEGTLVTFDASAEQEGTGLTGRQLGWGMFVLDAGETQ